MGTAVKPTATFASARELREVLEKLLRSIDGDSRVGAKLQSTHVPHRYEAPDLGVVLNVADSHAGDHHLRWSFSDDVPWEPQVRLTMESGVLNRFLQGEENFAIALARGRMRCAGEARAALAFLPVARALAGPYSELIASDYPHLVV